MTDDAPITEPAPEETRRVDCSALLRAAVALGEAHSRVAVSTKHLALSELVRVWNAMPLADRVALAERFFPSAPEVAK